MPKLSYMRSNKNKKKKNNNSRQKALAYRETASATWNIRSGRDPLTVTPRWDNKPYHIIRSCNLSTVVTTSTTVISYAGIYFTLTNLDLTDGLNTVFDQYRILEIECKLTPFPGAAAPEVMESTQWVSCIDFDNATPPTTFAMVEDVPGCLYTTAACGHVHRWRPHIGVAAYAGAFTSYANLTDPWIDCVSSAVQHYGIKLAVLSSTTVFSIVATARFHLQFRNVI